MEYSNPIPRDDTHFAANFQNYRDLADKNRLNQLQDVFY